MGLNGRRAGVAIYFEKASVQGHELDTAHMAKSLEMWLGYLAVSANTIEDAEYHAALMWTNWLVGIRMVSTLNTVCIAIRIY